MLFTLGGLGIWTLIDFILTAMNKFKDGEGRLINRPANLGLVLGLIIGGFVFQVMFVGILSAIAIPQYNKYRLRAQEAIAVSAIDAIVSAQQLYFTDNNRYSTDYNELAELSLTKDIYVNYGPIFLKNGGRDFTFSISHEAPGATLFIYDSSNTDRKYTTRLNEPLKSSVW
jgi:Tfp pilus assembly protein PilE